MSRYPAVHTEMYKGYKIEIFSDNDAQNPQTEWDQACKMICWHRRYDLGDKHDFKEQRDFMESLVDEKDLTPEQNEDWDEISDADLFELAQKHNLICPLYLYDHSGITIRMSTGGNPFTCQWDSGQVGWVYISHADVKKEWDGDLVKALACMKAEVETYDDYLTGNVYGFVVSKNIVSDDEPEEWEEVDSCWGYYGDYINYGKDAEESYIMSEAKSFADHDEQKSLPLLARAGLLEEADHGQARKA